MRSVPQWYQNTVFNINSRHLGQPLCERERKREGWTELARLYICVCACGCVVACGVVSGRVCVFLCVYGGWICVVGVGVGVFYERVGEWIQVQTNNTSKTSNFSSARIMSDITVACLQQHIKMHFTAIQNAIQNIPLPVQALISTSLCFKCIPLSEKT